MLEGEGLTVGYGDAVAVWEVSLTMGERELVTVVGPNGAGKTTLINALAGLLPIRGARCVSAGWTWVGCRRTTSASTASRWSPRDAGCSGA